MNCPIDGATLLMSERSGIEIDYCPTCRGIWLDRGELDKLIERADQLDDGDRDRRPERSDRDRRDDNRRDEDRHSHDSRTSYDQRQFKRKKKSSFLSEIFEFGD